MRDAIRIQLTPSEYRDHMDAEREKTLELLLLDLERARETDAEWYRWIAKGCQPLSVEEYSRLGKFAKSPATSPDGDRVHADEQLQVGA